MKPFLVRIERTETHEATVEIWANTEDEARLHGRHLANEAGGRWLKTNEETAVDVEEKR